METFLRIMQYISGPIIGAVIGYFTNYLAVKMLFRPYYPKKIGKWQLPFTPGIIPKRKPQLAKAIGKAVGEELFTEADLRKMLVSEESKEKVSTAIVERLCVAANGQAQTAETLALSLTSRDEYENTKARLTETLSETLARSAKEADIGRIVAEQGRAVVNEKKASLGMLAFVLSDGMVNGVLDKFAEKINAYIAENGAEKLLPVVKERVDEFSEKPIGDALSDAARERLKKAVGEAYEKLLVGAGDVLFQTADISEIVEEKVNAMDVRALEKLCMSVMKKELTAVVNLGALLGFLIGILNIFI